MRILFYSLLIAFIVFLVASVMVWAFRIRRYVEAHGERCANIFFRLGSPMLHDYQTAHRIADRAGKKPGCLILFGRLFGTATALFIASALVLLIRALR
jgi:hypothetical protein